MPRYRPYQESIDQLGYASYVALSTPPRAEANRHEFQAALAELKQLAVSSGKNIRDVSILNEVISQLLKTHPQLSEWCKNKSISLTELFPSRLHDLPAFIALIHMAKTANAFIDSSSLDYLSGMVASLDPKVLAIVQHEKINVELAFGRSNCLSGRSSNSCTELLMSVISEASFIESGEQFHAICANEFQYMATLQIRTVFANCSPQACSQFFSLCDRRAKTPLIAATLFGMRDAVKLIIQNALRIKEVNIHLNEKDDLGYTALDYAFLLGYTDLVLLLLKAGAVFSSPSIIEESINPETISKVFSTAIVCPDRHFDACLNYLYSSEGRHYPLMVTDEMSSTEPASWRFVVMHPQNADAISVIKEAPSVVSSPCMDEFRRLQNNPETMTVREHRLKCLNDKKFLNKFIYSLVLLGSADEVMALLKLHPSVDLIHHQSAALNLLHICTNSFHISVPFVQLPPVSFNEIIAGRVKLARCLLQEHPELADETTRTSEGTETFHDIVTRMNTRTADIVTVDQASTFNTLLYTALSTIVKPTVAHETTMLCATQ